MNEVFAINWEYVQAAIYEGEWPDYTSGNVDKPLIHRWCVFPLFSLGLVYNFLLLRPLDTHGIQIQPEIYAEISLYHIHVFSCLCSTQEADSNEHAVHTGHIHVCSNTGQYYGKVVYMAVCPNKRDAGSFVCPQSVLR